MQPDNLNNQTNVSAPNSAAAVPVTPVSAVPNPAVPVAGAKKFPVKFLAVAIIAIVVVGIGAYFGIKALGSPNKPTSSNDESRSGNSSTSEKMPSGSATNGGTVKFGEYSAEAPKGFSSEEVKSNYATVQMKSETSLIKISVHDDEKADYQATKKSWLESDDEGTTTEVKNFDGVEYVVMTEYDAEDDYTYIDALTPIEGAKGYVRIMTHFKGNDTVSFEKYVPAIVESIK